jgi:uncharacterized protein
MTVGERRPDRTLRPVDQQFWQFCASRQFWLQQCGDCDIFVWPPVEACEECGGRGVQWRPASGRGRLKSWATFERKYYDGLPVPWETILVELDEGPLFVSNPSGFTTAQMILDLPLRVDFIDCEDDNGAFLLPVFRRIND